MENTPNLNLPYIAASQAQKHVTHNEAIRNLDALTQLSVLDRDISTPPLTNSDGDRFIVASVASGDWTGKEGYIAAWQDGVWVFHQPKNGWICWIADEAIALGWNGSAWDGISTSVGVNPTPLVGINTTANSTNKLAVSSAASLFTHEGADHRLVINKNGETDTASLLYQNNFSGRAEIGLTGSDDFFFKVSADGVIWKDAIQIGRTSGLVTFTGSGAVTSTNPNLLINGSMSINQRGFAGGALVAGDYGFDRWKADTGGANVSVAGDVITLTSGTIVQVIEAPLLAGKTVTFSVEDLTSGDLDLDIEGVAGTVTPGSGRNGASIAIPPGSTGNITVKLTPDIGAVTFTRIKLEIGSAASEWVNRFVGDELVRCQRYFISLEKSAFYLPGNSARMDFREAVQFPVTMCATPTITLPSSSTSCWTSTGADRTPTSWQAVTVSKDGFAIRAYHASGVGGIKENTFEAEAEL